MPTVGSITRAINSRTNQSPITHLINPTTNTTDTTSIAGLETFGTNKWNGGVLATNGLNGLATAAGSDGANVTVFLPTDKAFRILVEDLLGVSIEDEAELFGAIVATVGVDTVSAILQYHVVPLVADSATVLSLGDGFEVPTLLVGETFELDFKCKKPQIRLVDDGGPGRDPIVRAVDLEASNGVAHVIDRVLIP